MTGGVILWTDGHYWLDPSVALVIGVVIGYQALRSLRDAVRELRTGSSAPPPPAG